MKRRALNIGLLLLFITGLVVFLYPIGTDYLANQKAQRIISDFEESARELRQSEKELSQSGESLEGLYADMQAYNLNLYENGQGSLQDPFSYETPAFDLTGYGFEENMVGYIRIPKIDVELPIYLGASNTNLALGAGNLGYTSIPIGGANTNTVLAAHRGYRGASMFRDIEAMQIGDRVYITNFWETLAYEVTETKVILPTDVQGIYIRQGQDIVTLITCHPYTKNIQRYVVFCVRVDLADTNSQPESENAFHWNELSESERLIFAERWFSIGVTVLLLLLIMIQLILWVFRKHRKDKGGKNLTD